MKYIRTKSKIYEVESEFLDNKGKWVGYNIVEDDMAVILKIQVINQADTIEELCDYFVYKNTIFEKIRKPKREDEIALLVNPLTREFGFVAQGISKTMLQLGNEVYGAIWTDKGLIYVAKMNDKGELELL